jgi:hypothetical protein
VTATHKQLTYRITVIQRLCLTLTWNKTIDIESFSVATFHPDLPLPNSNGRIDVPVPIDCTSPF